MLTIGLTGGIGSGKSSVAQWFKEQGVPIIDADQIVHNLLNSDQKIISELVDEFGNEILDTSGEKINRQVLGSKVFGDKQARHKLEQIIHPHVVRIMRQERIDLEHEGLKICVWDVPLLFEGGLHKYVDQVWVVWVPQEVQIQRVLGRDKLTRTEIIDRILAQLSLNDKLKFADVVIDNSGDWTHTQTQLEELFSVIQKKINSTL
ncbi:MAG: dephospho-CoA kinase [Desulfitobacteriaceae bacterium]